MREVRLLHASRERCRAAHRGEPRDARRQRQAGRTYAWAIRAGHASDGGCFQASMMGTNYYLRLNACSKCGHSDAEVHIGKSSMGWTFTFHATDVSSPVGQIRSEDGWRDATLRGRIFNEYGEEMLDGVFWRLVDSKRDAKFNHAVEEKKNGNGYGGDRASFLDDKGNSFSPYEFS